MIKSLKNYWLIILLAGLVVTCTINTGYIAYAKGKAKEKSAQDYLSKVSTLMQEFNAMPFDSVISDLFYTTTSTKQTAFTYPEKVFIEAMFQDAVIINDTCWVEISDQVHSNYGFKLYFDNCDQLNDYQQIFDQVFGIAELQAHTFTDTSFYYIGSLEFIERLN